MTLVISKPLISDENEKNISLDTFIRKDKRLKEEIEEGSRPTSFKKQKAAFKRKYNESYLKHGFVAAGESDIPYQLCIICGDVLSNEAMKPSKLSRHLVTKHPDLKDNPLVFFERRNCEHEKRTQSVMATTTTNANALSLILGGLPYCQGQETFCYR